MRIYLFPLLVIHGFDHRFLPSGAVCLTSLLACLRAQGLMTRTAKMCESGIKPVYVFDGKAPDCESPASLHLFR